MVDDDYTSERLLPLLKEALKSVHICYREDIIHLGHDVEDAQRAMNKLNHYKSPRAVIVIGSTPSSKPLLL